LRVFKVQKGREAVTVEFEKYLNEQQFAAVRAGSGPKLVIAGAGSGKTRVITYRVAYLLACGVRPHNILLMTFTNKAAREMLSRVESLVGGAARDVWGGTFHAVGNRILRRHAELLGYQGNYSILDEEDQKDLIRVCVSDLGIKTDKERFPSPAVLRDIISFSFNTRTPLESVLEKYYPQFYHWAEEISKLSTRYGERKRMANSMDYDDLLGNWLALLKNFPDILDGYGRQFQHILVDEYQDTNVIQAEIVELLASVNGGNIMVVGDDCQSIYAFRGANYDNILRFPERNPGTEIFKLEINYRSTPEILNFTNDSILHNPNQYRKILRSVKQSGLLPVVVPVRDMYEEASFVCERILQLNDEGTPLDRIAVLYRAHAHSMALQAELLRRMIPYEVRSGLRFFEQAHIKDVVSYIKVIENPFDEVAWRRLMLMVPKIGNIRAGRIWGRISKVSDPIEEIGKDEFIALLPKDVRRFWKRFADDLNSLREISKTNDPGTVVAAILETDYTDYLQANYENSESRLEDIRQLAVLASRYRSLESFLSELVLLGELYGQDVGPEAPESEKLVLSSVHQAKGLEWKYVFIIRMVEGAFPSPMALREESGEEEERRVFYVATTRAQDELYITYPVIDVRGWGYNSIVLQPSRFLQEIDQKLYEVGKVEEL